MMTPEEPTRPISPLYARYLTAAEKKSLRAVPAADLASEIKLLRVLAAHFLKFQQSAPKDLNSREQTLRTGLMLGIQMARLVRAHHEAYDPNADGRDKEIRVRFGKRPVE